MSLFEEKKAKLESLLAETNRIMESPLSWEAKYDAIFSEAISRRVFALLSLDYYDPDTSYEEDVNAFVDAFRHRMSEYYGAH